MNAKIRQKRGFLQHISKREANQLAQGRDFNEMEQIKNHLNRGGFLYFKAGVAKWVAREMGLDLFNNKTKTIFHSKFPIFKKNPIN